MNFQAVISAIILIPRIISIKTTELLLTNKKVFGKNGVLQTKELYSPLNKINNIAIYQGLGGKIFKYATIVISTSSGGYKYNYIKNADELRSDVMQQIEISEEERIRRQAEQLANTIRQQ